MAELAAAPRVLIVDDDHTIARLVVHVVRSLGFGLATHVTTGREGLRPGSFTAEMVALVSEGS
jgi:CheY-like chemotaxis protein